MLVNLLGVATRGLKGANKFGVVCVLSAVASVAVFAGISEACFLGEGGFVEGLPFLVERPGGDAGDVSRNAGELLGEEFERETDSFDEPGSGVGGGGGNAHHGHCFGDATSNGLEILFFVGNGCDSEPGAYGIGSER